MANTDRLAEVVAALAERNQEFAPVEQIKIKVPGGEPVWRLSELKKFLGYSADASIDKAVNRAKISTDTAGMQIKEHFIDGEHFGVPGDLCVTKYAAFL